MSAKKQVELEIERRFLVTELPGSLEVYQRVDIVQGYLVVAGTRQVRIRQKGNDFYLTVKDGEGLVRMEAEIELDASRFEALWPFTRRHRLKKTRYRIPEGGFLLVLDVFHGRLAPLMLAEVEFASEAESELFDPPAWLGEEVTMDARYSNRSLARFGIPEAQ